MASDQSAIDWRPAGDKEKPAARMRGVRLVRAAGAGA